MLVIKEKEQDKDLIRDSYNFTYEMEDPVRFYFVNPFFHEV